MNFKKQLEQALDNLLSYRKKLSKCPFKNSLSHSIEQAQPLLELSSESLSGSGPQMLWAAPREVDLFHHFSGYYSEIQK